MIFPSILVFFSCHFLHGIHQDASKLQSSRISHPSLFDQSKREPSKDKNILWFIEGYYGVRGFEITSYEIQDELDEHFRILQFSQTSCVPPACTVLYTEPNQPPEIAFWQSLITHFTYFSPLDLDTIAQQGWGTITHNQNSLQKEFVQEDFFVIAIIEKEILDFIPTTDVTCHAETRTYSEEIQSEPLANSIDQWLIDNGYRISQIKYYNNRTHNQFLFAQLHQEEEYQLLLQFENTFVEGNMEQLSQIELRCASKKPMYAIDIDNFSISRFQKTSEQNETWEYHIHQKTQ